MCVYASVHRSARWLEGGADPLELELEVLACTEGQTLVLIIVQPVLLDTEAPLQPPNIHTLLF